MIKVTPMDDELAIGHEGRITAPNPWAGLPHHWVESGEIEQTFELGPDQVSTSTEFLNRYAGIAVSFLDRDHPLDIRTLGHLISRRAQELGLRTSLTGKKLIANYKCPRSVAFLEALPISGAGKILKNKLREPFWKNQQRSVG